jgi:type I restriction-modification system DNA methylase subunit
VADKKKQEALTVTRFIHEILLGQLSIPLRQIVNDTTFASYTGTKRPDLLISEFEYDMTLKNDKQFIENLVAYAEAKDDCVVDDIYWRDAVKQGLQKAPKLKLPYFIVTNCKATIFYNVATGKQIKLNGNPIREFQTIDILRIIKNRLTKNPTMEDIRTNVDSLAVISEAIFNKKLWELEKIYRMINFDNKVHTIDFTIGFVSLAYFEEREKLKGKLDATKLYWSNCIGVTPEQTVANLSQYIARLEKEQFGEFSSLMEKVRVTITGTEKKKAVVTEDEVQQIYNVIDSMKPLHGTGFDLFGAVYEKFADPKEKKEFGQYFTRRHYTHIFAKLLLRNEKYFDKDNQFTVLDPACGTGGFLTEGFKVLSNAYFSSGTLSKDAVKFIENECFWGVDVKSENISRTKLNMFLVGDGHTHMKDFNALIPQAFCDQKWKYILTNPPVGAGTIRAETTVISSKRTEVAFLYKVINLLKDGGKACVLLPDGILENPLFTKLRKDILEKCNIEAIASLPTFAFAPYTKEHMFAVFLTKKKDTKIQKEPIWMYIIDNDGLANSDKRFPTKLRNNRNGWMHDEISGWVTTDGEEMAGLLEDRWLTFDDSATKGTEWTNGKGQLVKYRKGGFIDIHKIVDPQSQYCLLPEYYLRPFEAKFSTEEELNKEIISIETELKILTTGKRELTAKNGNQGFQAKNVPISEVLDCYRGNSGLTEEEIYQKILMDGERFEVLSSSTKEDTKMGVIPMSFVNGKKLNVFEGEEGILVIRNGKAGTTFFLDKGKYAITDHAYILAISKDCKYKVSLKWVMLQYRQTFLDYTSTSSPNATWNMTGFFDEVKIDIPEYDEQERLVKKWEILDALRTKLKQVTSEAEAVCNRQLIS